MVNTTNYKTIKEMAKLYSPLFTEAAFRQMLFKNTGDIQKVVFKIGGKVFFDVEKFEKWFKEQQEKSK
jgi:hypothetical protein